MKRQVRTFTFLPSVDNYLENPYWKLLKDALVETGLHYVDKSEGRTPFFGRRWMLENRGKVDVIHLHFVQQFYGYQYHYARLRWVLRFMTNLLLARALGYRTVFTMHDLKPTLPLEPYWVDYLGHWAAANLTNAVMVHSRAAERELARYYKRVSNVIKVNHPSFIGMYPDHVSREQARDVYKIPMNQRVLLYFGGIRPNKGIDALIHAFSEIDSRTLRLIIAGKPQDGISYGDEIVRLASRDERIIVIPQYIPDDQIQYLMHCADIAVMPFESIQTSGSVLLAMSFSKPVLAPGIGDLPELVQPDMGYLYNPLEPAALQQMIRHCVQVPTEELQQRGANAFMRVKPLTFSLLAQQTTNVYGSA